MENIRMRGFNESLKAHILTGNSEFRCQRENEGENGKNGRSKSRKKRKKAHVGPFLRRTQSKTSLARKWLFFDNIYPLIIQ